jgi:hypothetical protein
MVNRKVKYGNITTETGSSKSSNTFTVTMWGDMSREEELEDSVQLISSLSSSKSKIPNIKCHLSRIIATFTAGNSQWGFAVQWEDST